MDWLTFFSNVIHDLTWPTTFFLSGYLLLKNGEAVSSLIESFSFKDFEIKMRQGFEKARAASEEVKSELQEQSAQSPSQDVIKGTTTALDEMKYSDEPPQLVVLGAWRKFEKVVNQVARTAASVTGVGGLPYLPTRELIRRFTRDGDLTAADRQLYQTLSDIRTRVVHSRSSEEMTQAELDEFLEMLGNLTIRMHYVGAKYEIQQAAKDKKGNV